MGLRIFIVDDDPDYAAVLRYQLRRQADPVVELFTSGEAALERLDDPPDLILLDIAMPGQGGLETLRQIKARRRDLPVVMVSAQTDVSVALEAMRLGAYDYVTKGHDDAVKLDAIVAHVAERAALSREVASLRAQLPAPQGLPGILGESGRMVRVFRLIQKVLKGDLTVAIQGESGTGKELVAQAIHYNSARRRGPFVVVNCAAIPRELMESEFFGHEKGAFTGAHARQVGRFEQAGGGTLFLDEIGELNLDLQAKLLRVLQDGQFQRVGGTQVLHADVRVIVATNRDVVQMIREGTFREDLYYRLFQFPLHLPPLRERDQDALLLAEHFRRAFLEQHPDVEPRPLSAAVRRYILRYPWPGNVRELKNAVEWALLLSESAELQPEDLLLDEALPFSPTSLPARPPSMAGRLPSAAPDPVGAIAQAEHPNDIVPIEMLKRLAVERALQLCEGNIEKTATSLGVTRSTIYRLLKKYDVSA